MSLGVLVNHVISFLTSPLSVSLAVLAAGAVAVWRGVRWGAALVCGGVLLLYVFSAGVTYGILGGHLERMYPPQTVESVPSADAILLLGGGIGMNTNRLVYAECAMSADRTLHAFRLYRAGKARRIFVTSVADRAVLVELGVNPADIAPPSGAGNTEEEIRHIAACRSELAAARPQGRPAILLVTSAWHMRRAMLMCARYAREIDFIPAATDYEALLHDDDTFDWRALLPGAEPLFKTSYMVKEIVGYWGYRLLR